MYYWRITIADTGEIMEKGFYPSADRAEHEARSFIENSLWYNAPNIVYSVNIYQGEPQNIFENIQGQQVSEFKYTRHTGDVRGRSWGEERLSPYGQPRTDIERAMNHYGITSEEYLANPQNYPLPDRMNKSGVNVTITDTGDSIERRKGATIQAEDFDIENATLEKQGKRRMRGEYHY